jgi:ABC-type branched-subunit amino acid transport system ATPase component
MTRFVIAAVLLLTGCAEYNAAVSGATAFASGQVTIQQQNIQALNDVNAKAWADAGCAVPYGELVRNGSGHTGFAQAIVELCGAPAGTTLIHNIGTPTATTTIPTTTVVVPAAAAK